MTAITPSYIGQHIVLALSGPQVTQEERELLRTVRPKGLILAGRNFATDLPYSEWHAELEQFIREVRQLSGQRDMLVALDHEGGRSTSHSRAFNTFPFCRRVCS